MSFVCVCACGWTRLLIQCSSSVPVPVKDREDSSALSEDLKRVWGLPALWRTKWLLKGLKAKIRDLLSRADKWTRGTVFR